MVLVNFSWQLFIIIVQNLFVLLGIAAIYMAYYSVKTNLIAKLRYEREFSVQGTFEGDEALLIETIYNGSILPLFFVDVKSYVYSSLKLADFAGGGDDQAMQPIVSRFHLMPHMQIKRRHKIKCLHRGYYKLNTACVVTQSIGRIKTTYFNSEAEIYVYPKIIELQSMPYPVNLLQGDSISKRRVMQDPFLASGIRDYAFGDPFRMINFKATAKSGFLGMGSIKVNKLDYCSDRVFMIYVNFQIPPEIASIPGEIYESLMEQGLSFAATFIGEALRSGYKAGFAANCHMANGDRRISFPVFGGLGHIEEMLREMAKVQTRSGMSFTSLLESGIGASICNTEIFIVTLYVDRSIDESIAMLKMRNNAVTAIELENEEYNHFMVSVGNLRKNERA